MAAKKVGELVKEARTAANLTQEKLAKAVGGNLTAADISKCERGEADLPAATLKKIAVACGVTQASLVNAPKNLSAAAAKKAAAAKSSTAKASAAKTGTAKTSAAKTGSAKTSAAKTGTAKTDSAKTSAGKTGTAKTGSAKTSAASTAAKVPKTPANANTSMKVTATEKKLIQAYRGAASDRKKAAMKLLEGEYGDAIDKILSLSSAAGGGASSSSSTSGAPEVIGDLLGSVLGGLLGGK